MSKYRLRERFLSDIVRQKPPLGGVGDGPRTGRRGHGGVRPVALCRFFSRGCGAREKFSAFFVIIYAIILATRKLNVLY
jgi:hypothetical protein